MVSKASNEATKPSGHETNDLGVNLGLAKKDGKSLEIVTKMKMNGQNLNSIINGPVEEILAQSIEVEHDQKLASKGPQREITFTDRIFQGEETNTKTRK